MRSLARWALALCLTGLPLAAALAQDGIDAGPSLSAPGDVGIISLQSKHAVRITADRLEQGLRDKGLKLFARIDHTAQAEAVKLALRPTQLLIFGDPRSGTLLMHQNQTLGLDLPLKYLVWESTDHKVYISWNNPYYLAQRHGIPANMELLTKLSQNLFQLAKKAAS
ncbi:MAG: hypothetical protein CVV27_06810 [Candidatus Melainabacteria bacterium HGW-Melainabacteria-1]|nr:MAG: hypothetical protein CVV27_06810 [Candidatus Melainabacteria bacterium HGW-Melainabacteria-1]